MENKVILSNVGEYYITDTTCENLIYNAREYNVGEVLLGASSIPCLLDMLNKTNIKLGVTISYPSGCYLPEAKIGEIEELKALYTRIDAFYAVVAEGRFLSGYTQEFRNEVRGLVNAAGEKQLFVITEIASLTEDQAKEFIAICKEENVAGIVMSTGFYPYKASAPTVDQMKAFKELAGDLPVICFDLDINDSIEVNPNKIITKDFKLFRER